MSPETPREATALGLVGAPRPIDAGVWIAAALLLTASAGFARVARPGAHPLRALDGHVALTVPPGLTADETGGALIVRRPALGSVAPTLRVELLERPADVPPALFNDLALTRIERERARSGVGYRTLDAGEAPAFAAEHSSYSRYAVVRDPPLSQPGDAVMPVVVTGFDALVVNGERVYHVSTSVEASDQTGERELDALLASLRFTP